jgi:hypothetical protein
LFQSRNRIRARSTGRFQNIRQCLPLLFFDFSQDLFLAQAFTLHGQIAISLGEDPLPLQKRARIKGRHALRKGRPVQANQREDQYPNHEMRLPVNQLAPKVQSCNCCGKPQ